MERESLRKKKAVIGIGAAKTGSTSMYYMLRQHPDIYMSPIKETNYFSFDIKPSGFRDDYKKMPHIQLDYIDRYFRNKHRELAWSAYGLNESQYLQLFEEGSEYEYVGEVSNSYMYDPEAIRHIKDFFTEVKFFVILRNPVDRLLSHYKAFVREGRTIKNNLLDELEHDLKYSPREWGKAHLYVDMGYYARQLKNVLKYIDRDDLFVIFQEDMHQSSAAVYSNLIDWLGLDASVKINTERKNTAKMPKYPGLISYATKSGLRYSLGSILPNNVKKHLKEMMYKKDADFRFTANEIAYVYDFYREEISELEELLGVDLEHWRQ